MPREQAQKVSITPEEWEIIEDMRHQRYSDVLRHIGKLMELTTGKEDDANLRQRFTALYEEYRGLRRMRVLLHELEAATKEEIETQISDRMGELLAEIEAITRIQLARFEGIEASVFYADIKLAPFHVSKPEQGYPTTPEEWKQAEQEADEDLAAGNYEDFDSMEAFLADLMDGNDE